LYIRQFSGNVTLPVSRAVWLEPRVFGEDSVSEDEAALVEQRLLSVALRLFPTIVVQSLALWKVGASHKRA